VLSPSKAPRCESNVFSKGYFACPIMWHLYSL
jgi:hypothetical protein